MTEKKSLEGWQWFEPTPTEKVPDVSDLDLLIFKVFETEKGKQLYEEWAKIEQVPNLPLHASDGAMLSSLMAFKEGEKNFFRRIRNSINKVKNNG